MLWQPQATAEYPVCSPAARGGGSPAGAASSLGAGGGAGGRLLAGTPGPAPRSHPSGRGGGEKDEREPPAAWYPNGTWRLDPQMMGWEEGWRGVALVCFALGSVFL